MTGRFRCLTLARSVVALAVVALPRSAMAQAAPLAGLDAYIKQSMSTWRIPGLAIAIVRGDSVIFARGYGVREVGKSAPVDERTLFAIGSATKSFTAAALGMLVDEGRLQWDDRVIDVLPGFRLHDPYVTREVTVRDLLSHRTGLSGGDLLWGTGEFDRAEIVRRARYLEPAWSFRSRFDYSNIMYIAAGEVLAARSGQSWDDFIRERIFTPLKMTASNTSVTALVGRDNVATPHDDIEGVIRRVPWRNMDNTVAGGGINSNVLDMARWLQVNLDNGRAGGRQLLGQALREMRIPHTPIRREGPWASMTPGAHFMAYGMGWILSDYRGRLALQHGGGIDGMSSMVGLLPEERVGVVVLTNLNGNFLPAALMFRVFDLVLGAPLTDWSAQGRTMADSMRASWKSAEKARESTRVAAPPVLPLADYAGTYRSELYGDLVVTEDKGRLTARFGSYFDGTLEPWSYNAFRAHWRNPAAGSSYLSFTLDDSRKIVTGLTAYSYATVEFKRVTPEGAKAPSR